MYWTRKPLNMIQFTSAHIQAHPDFTAKVALSKSRVQNK